MSKSKLVWITGASTGIGAELARAYARMGWTVAASARTAEKLDVLRADYEKQIHSFPVDVTDPAAVAETVAVIEDALGLIDLAILNAGTYTPTPVADFTEEIVKTTMDVNVLGVSNALAALMPRMVERRSGHLALMSSVAGYRGLPMAAAYSASKAAVIAMGQSLKAELDDLGVKIQVICPGFVKTPLTAQNEFPMPYLMEVEDAAQRIVEGLRGDSFEIAFPKRFAWQLKTMQRLPDGVFFPLIKRATGH